MELKPTTWMLDDKDKHVSKVLMLENVTMMNIQLKTGEIIPEHDSPREVLIIVKRGSVTFTVENEEVVVTSENTLHMAPFEKHSLRATEDSDVMVMQITP